MIRETMGLFAGLTLLTSCSILDDIKSDTYSHGARAKISLSDAQEFGESTDQILIEFAKLAGHPLTDTGAVHLQQEAASGGSDAKPRTIVVEDAAADVELAALQQQVRDAADTLGKKESNLQDKNAEFARLSQIAEDKRTAADKERLKRLPDEIKAAGTEITAARAALDAASNAFLAIYGPKYGYFWQRILEAGSLYIDHSCEAYIDALFDMHRTLNAGQGILSVIGAGSAGLLSVFDGSAKAFAAVAISLGISAGLLDVVYDSLLFKLDPATVKTLVISLRDGVREKYGRAGLLPASKAETLLILSRYVDTCVPTTIEAEVNRILQGTTFTQVRGGAAPADRIGQYKGEVDKTRSTFSTPQRQDITTGN